MIKSQVKIARNTRHIGVLLCVTAQASIILLGCKYPAIPVILISYVALCLIKLSKMIDDPDAPQ